PSCRFDLPPAAAPQAQAPAAPIALNAGTQQLVDALIRTEPVVLFSLEWCEFCWSVRKLFSRVNLQYRSVDLDSVEYQKDDLGGKIRAVLAARTGARTIPQIFVAGEHIGGCTDFFNAWREGSIQRVLTRNGVAFDAAVEIDPFSLLPKWQQPRK